MTSTNDLRGDVRSRRPVLRSAAAALVALIGLVIALVACGGPEVPVPAPAGVRVESAGAALVVRWTPPAGAVSGFDVYREPVDPQLSVASEANDEPIARLGGGATSYRDASIELGLRYRYRVVARNGARSSEPAASEPARVAPLLEGVVGAFTVDQPWATEPVTAIVFFWNDRTVPPEGTIEVEVNGPAGWNDDEPWRDEFDADRLGDGITPIYDQTPAVDGIYTVTTIHDGTERVARSEVSLAAALPPSSVMLEAFAADEVTIAWDDVEGAVAYQVVLRSDLEAYERHDTTSRTHTFSGLDLQPGEYHVGVAAFGYAWPVDGSWPERPYPYLVQSWAQSQYARVPWPAGVFYPVDPQGRYLEAGIDDDEATDATSLALADLGVAPGECIGAMRVGDFSYHAPSADESGRSTGAVFAGAEGFLAAANADELEPIASSPVDDGVRPVDIDEDVYLPGVRVALEVPPGAEALRIAASDGYSGDNADLDANYGVLLAPMDCP